jgi:hypothetical protein
VRATWRSPPTPSHPRSTAKNASKKPAHHRRPIPSTSRLSRNSFPNHTYAAIPKSPPRNPPLLLFPQARDLDVTGSWIRHNKARPGGWMDGWSWRRADTVNLLIEGESCTPAIWRRSVGMYERHSTVTHPWISQMRRWVLSGFAPTPQDKTRQGLQPKSTTQHSRARTASSYKHISSEETREKKIGGKLSMCFLVVIAETATKAGIKFVS